MLIPAAALTGRLIYRYPGVPHAFHSQFFSTLFPWILPDVSLYQVLFRSMKLSQRFQEETIEGMSWLFSKTPQ